MANKECASKGVFLIWFLQVRETEGGSYRIMLKNLKCVVKTNFQTSILKAGCELLLFQCFFLLLICISVSMFWLHFNHKYSW